MRRLLFLSLLLAPLPLAPALAAAPAPAGADALLRDTRRLEGLLEVHADAAGGRILLTLPAPASDGISGRFLYTSSLRTGLGSAPTFLDRGKTGNTQLLAFRRIGKKVAVQFENPRFRATASDFATSIVWMGDVAATLPDGRLVVDIAPFLATDVVGIADSLNQAGDPLGVGGGQQGAGKGFKLNPALSGAEAGSIKVFPDNIEVDAVQTYGSDTPGEEVANIAPEPKQVSFTVHHSLVRLPATGFAPRKFDVRIGGFPTQVVDFAAPLGADVVQDFANRFRLEKVDPAAPRSRVKKPIVFYVDRNAPEPIRTALVEGVNWWASAFEAAGYVDAFRAELLPDGADPLDVRYNLVNWVARATRGWAYGQEIVDPRTGEIVKGMVVLGSLRARQDIRIYEALVGADKTGKGGPQDPAQIALARLRQLAAHEVGHSLGFAHNFAASTQGRASVMDYPAPRIGLADGRPDLSDAYGVGLGRWDVATVDWLYGEGAPGSHPDAAATARASAALASGLRFAHDGDARSADSGQAWGGLWDDGADPVAELGRMMEVRRAAIAGFGLDAIAPGEPVAELKRRFVPVWLLHRYQLVAAAKSLGGYDYAYSVKGGGRESAVPVPADRQRAALSALLATLSPAELRVPERLLPLLSMPANGSDNRQYDVELFGSAGGRPIFDPLAAADAAAQISLGAIAAPARLARLEIQKQGDARALGAGETLDRLLAATLPSTNADALAQRIFFRTIVTLAQVARRPGTSPEIANAIEARLHATALALGRRTGADRLWAAPLSRQLLDPRELDKLAAERPRPSRVPPGDPIGSGEEDWMDFY